MFLSPTLLNSPSDGLLCFCDVWCSGQSERAQKKAVYYEEALCRDGRGAIEAEKVGGQKHKERERRWDRERNMRKSGGQSRERKWERERARKEMKEKQDERVTE